MLDVNSHVRSLPGVQFRLLYRHFLFRLMDVEQLSGSARGDSSAILGQLGALLIFGSILVSLGAVTVGQAVHRDSTFGSSWSAERFLISLTMLVVGVFALLSWDSILPDRRDVLVLGPLPVRETTLMAAKIAASAAALGLVIVTWNSFAGIAWPLVLAPASIGFWGTARFIVAFWFTLFAAGTFLYCTVLGVQAAASQLPRAWYLRVSPILQIAGLVVFVSVICFQPYWPDPQALALPQNQATLAWLPAYWFGGLLYELSGAYGDAAHAAMAPLAMRAAVNLGIAILAAATAFLLSHLRTLRKIVEAPDVVPTARGGIWLPRFGSLPQTALAQFVIRTMLRSRQHRTIVAFYAAGGFAITAVYLQGARQALHLSGREVLSLVNGPLLASSFLMLLAFWLGTRTVFSLPLDMRANWLFRITPTLGATVSLSAGRRALWTLSGLPVLIGFAVFAGWSWPLVKALKHLIVLGLMSSILADASLRGFLKIPFTCSYLPGKSKVHMVFWFGVIPVVIAVHQLAALERRTMESPLSYGAMLAALVIAALSARWITNLSVKRDQAEIQFEDSPPDELIGLGLTR